MGQRGHYEIYAQKEREHLVYRARGTLAFFSLSLKSYTHFKDMLFLIKKHIADYAENLYLYKKRIFFISYVEKIQII